MARCFRFMYYVIACLIVIVSFIESLKTAETQLRVGCWNVYHDVHRRGGKSVPHLKTLDQCQNFCAENSSCIGVDFDPKNPVRQYCWILFDTTMVAEAPGVSHYFIDRTCCWTGPIRSSEERIGTFLKENVTNVHDCLAECFNSPICNGIDFTDDNECFIVFTDESKLTVDDKESHYVSHYDIIRHCTNDVPQLSETVSDSQRIINNDNQCAAETARIAVIVIGILLFLAFIVIVVLVTLLRKKDISSSSFNEQSDIYPAEASINGSRMALTRYDELQNQYMMTNSWSPDSASSFPNTV